jgi:hypothetical protein
LATTKVDVNLIDASSIGDAKYLKGDGTWATIAAGGGLAGVQTYTTTGSHTWTKSTRESALGVTIKKLVVHVVGAGGASVNTSASAGSGGGGGGGYACKLLDVTDIGTCTATVGAGAAASAGGNSTFEKATGTGTFLVVTGNGGSVATLGYTSDPASGGSASNGDINIDGGWGAGCNGNDSNQWGGDSFFGSGGRPLSTGDPRSQVGKGPGAGPSGGNQNTGAGNAGNDGAIFVYEYQ